jgi:hypothetical protein
MCTAVVAVPEPRAVRSGEVTKQKEQPPLGMHDVPWVDNEDVFALKGSGAGPSGSAPYA